MHVKFKVKHIFVFNGWIFGEIDRQNAPVLMSSFGIIYYEFDRDGQDSLELVSNYTVIGSGHKLFLHLAIVLDTAEERKLIRSALKHEKTKC